MEHNTNTRQQFFFSGGTDEDESARVYFCLVLVLFSNLYQKLTIGPWVMIQGDTWIDTE